MGACDVKGRKNRKRVFFTLEFPHAKGNSIQSVISDEEFLTVGGTGCSSLNFLNYVFYLVMRSGLKVDLEFPQEVTVLMSSESRN